MRRTCDYDGCNFRPLTGLRSPFVLWTSFTHWFTHCLTPVRGQRLQYAENSITIGSKHGRASEGSVSHVKPRLYFRQGFVFVYLMCYSTVCAYACARSYLAYLYVMSRCVRPNGYVVITITVSSASAQAPPTDYLLQCTIPL